MGSGAAWRRAVCFAQSHHVLELRCANRIQVVESVSPNLVQPGPMISSEVNKYSTLCQISELLNKHFEEHQLGEGSLSFSGGARAVAIAKAVSAMRLEIDISNLSFQEKKTPTPVNDTIKTCFLQYTESLMAVTITSSNREAVERSMDLVSAYTTSSKELCEETTARIVQFSTVLLERVRGQASILMGYMIMYITRKCYEGWRNGAVEALNAALLPRLTDRSQLVRNNAIYACSLFLHDHFGEIVFERLRHAILWNLHHDPSSTNRVSALQALPASESIVDHIVIRVRDVKEKVRVQAVDTLGKLDPPLQMSPDTFAEVIRSGLSNRCASTKEATSKLICCKWMKAARFDPVQLLKHVDVIVNEEECNTLTRVILSTARSKDCAILADLSAPEIRLFQSRTSTMQQIVASEDAMDAEHLFYARVACIHLLESTLLSSEEKSDILSTVGFDIPVLCERLDQYSAAWSEAKRDGDSSTEDKCSFLCLQLLHLAELTGLDEEGSRRHFCNFLKNYLSSQSNSEDLIDSCVRALRAANSTETAFLDSIAEVITRLSNQTPQSGVTTKTFPPFLRLLSILAGVLEAGSSDVNSHAVFRQAQSIITAAVKHSAGEVREAGVCCLGTLGYFTEKAIITTDFKPIILETASNNDEKLEIRSQALLVLSDWTTIFPEMLDSSQINGRSIEFLGILETMIQHDNSAVATIAAEVSMKMLFSGRVCQPRLLARLLVAFFDFNPQIESHADSRNRNELGSLVRLQQLLSLFFTAFCVKSEYCRTVTIESLEFALAMAGRNESGKQAKTIKSLSFPHVKLIEFVCDAVSMGREIECLNLDTRMQRGFNIYLAVSVQVLRFLISEFEVLAVAQLRAICKFLSGLDLNLEGREKAVCLEMQDLLEDLGMILQDETSLNALSMVRRSISGVVNQPWEESIIDSSKIEPVSCNDVTSPKEFSSSTQKKIEAHLTDSESLITSMSVLSVADKENEQENGQGLQSSMTVSANSMAHKGQKSDDGVLESPRWGRNSFRR
eukprot:scaffold5943_cov134-Cylindrotheca_fusiformis.AAC.3